VPELTIPSLALVVLIGASGSGKSTFARKYFRASEVLSSDACRALVSDDENDQSATTDAFEVLHFVASKRLSAGRLTVIDATNVQQTARKPLIELARRYHVIPVALVFDLPERVSQERNRLRPDRDFGPHVVRRQLLDLRRSLRGLQREGFRQVHVLRSPEEVDAIDAIVREPLYSHLHQERGPFDVIGDVHGCFDELVALLDRLGYSVVDAAAEVSGYTVTPPPGRKAVFLGDLVDRGPAVTQVLRLVMSMVQSGAALCVPGNHEAKLLRALNGRNVQMTHGLPESLAQIADEPPAFVEEVKVFLDGLTSHYVLDGGKLVVAHAGLKAEMHGRGSRGVRDFALYGETTGETDEFGLPVRYPWAQDYRGKATVVYGHTPVPYPPQWLNNTICIDTGCVFGGRLTALRYPEKELVSVPAARVYYTPAKPLRTEAHIEEVTPRTAQQEHDDMLDLADVLGRRVISTRMLGNIVLAEENAAAALEAMSRFAVDPRWLVYLPPTMSPSETSRATGLLEHPAETFEYFRKVGVARVVCEEKHMGSRAVVVVCRDARTALRRFGVTGAEAANGGIAYTRTGRRFFEDRTLEGRLLDRVRAALDTAGVWAELGTDWFLLDCELLPWSAKAQELVRQQYAAVGSAATAALPVAIDALEHVAKRGIDATDLLDRYQARAVMVQAYVAAYGRYCWTVESLEDLKLAPFHVLASEGVVHSDKNHVWHMQTLARVSQADERLLLATPYQIVDIGSESSVAEAVAWWEALTGRGGEGMVVKPLDFVARDAKGRLVQPALKCRGREYLRLIYGPEYTTPEHLERLRARGVGAKRGLAAREFALGIEALERFVAHEPLRRVHECVFGVLGLESEPVDPRL
jgi:polynucleotide kinase-phosphatase